MKRVMNQLSKFVRQILRKREITNGSDWIQKKILDNRYYGNKRNIKTYRQIRYKSN